MAEYLYYIIEFDGRGDMLEPVNPRIFFENGCCQFRYDGPVPGYWGTHIRERHGLAAHFDVKWHLDRAPATPREDVRDDTFFGAPLLIPRH